MSAALSAFARRVAGDGVSVSFEDGRARVRGRVRSQTEAVALVDLVGAHEGVASVEPELDIMREGMTAEYPNR